jgi:transposase-like protein
MDVSRLGEYKSLRTEEKCIAALEGARWPGGVRCPQCGNQTISRFQTKGKSGKVRRLYQCLERECRYQFSATTGTIFHDSHLPLSRWFQAIALVCGVDVPLSVNQLRLALGVQYKTAAHVMGRIRQAVAAGSIELSTTADFASIPLPDEARRPPASMPQPVHQEIARPVRRRSKARTAQSSGEEPSTTADNMLSMFVTMAEVTVRPTRFFVNYLRNKVFT